MKRRILFCSDVALTQKLGAAKVLVEVAECMEQQGWTCRLAGPDEISPGLEHRSGRARLEAFCASQRQFLQQRAGDYDVVDYGHQYLPYPRRDFATNTLFVARSVLLTHQLERIDIPGGTGWRTRARALWRQRGEREYRRLAVEIASHTAAAGDLVNVSNTDDADVLADYGIARHKIVVLPFGISPRLRPRFDAVSSEVPRQPVVAFVGTFDYRKGAAEFPRLAAEIVRAVPSVRFKLLGTRGLFQTAEQVLAHFPSTLGSRIEVVPQFDPETLPQLLAPCSIGVFPSHLEGFGFGVVEMMAASLPVIAYNVPGPPMMLPAGNLVPRGDYRAMARKVTDLLLDDARLLCARRWARDSSRRFDWNEIARQTSEVYLEHLQRLRGQ